MYLECALSIFSCFNHRFHAVSAQDIDVPGGPDGLAAFWANQLAGAAGALAAWCRAGSRLGRSSRGSRADKRRHARPSDFDFIPVL